MDKPTSSAGTTIAFDPVGEGPPVVLMSGSFDRAENARLAAPLRPRFTVLNYHRRDQGYSGNTQPWAIECEVEDLEAIIDEAGGRRLCSAVPATGSSPSRRQPAGSPSGS